MIDITHHAVARFIERHRPDLSVESARIHLASRAESASPIRERTRSGQEQWQIDDPPCLLVMKRDAGLQWAVVTVLPVHETFATKMARESAFALAERQPPRLSVPAPVSERTAPTEVAPPTVKADTATSTTNPEKQTIGWWRNRAEGAQKHTEHLGRELLRIRDHAKLMEDKGNAARQALRLAARHLRSRQHDAEAASVLEEMIGHFPPCGDDSFVDHEPTRKAAK